MPWIPEEFRPYFDTMIRDEQEKTVVVSEPLATTYDSDAPIAEHGALTPKSHAFRDLLHTAAGAARRPLPADPPLLSTARSPSPPEPPCWRRSARSPTRWPPTR
ncbi:hypothetical protein ACFYQA_07925 [Streptomyces sp. NPDC005774]|uniref:hypothetical protein n=1 Tax=Streptomyces sp. NPDC005774 TaxID=3364728 RepID=UPI0036CBA3FF